MIDIDLLLKGDRRSLAKAITLIESHKPEHQHAVQQILESLPPTSEQSFIVAISGPPGVGKSSLIEKIGHDLIESEGQKIAVLAIDPSSPITGGSILGDKTRMTTLATHPNAYVRPSPAGASLGGITRTTPVILQLLSAVGFNTIIIETVGVGQSEHLAALWVNCFVLLLSPGAGDELQGIKRGVMEVADVIAITKADGDHEPLAKKTEQYVKSALRLLKSNQRLTSVKLVSTQDPSSIQALWQECQLYSDTSRTEHKSTQQLQTLAQEWLWLHAMHQKSINQSWQEMLTKLQSPKTNIGMELQGWIKSIQISSVNSNKNSTT